MATNITQETHHRFAAAGRLAFSQGESIDKALAEVEQHPYVLLMSPLAQQEIRNSLAQGWFDAASANLAIKSQVSA